MVAFVPLFMLNEADKQIYTMTIDGENLKRLTNSTDSLHVHAWSPDGGKIAYTSVGNSQHERDGIYLINADGTRSRRIVAIDFGQDMGPDRSLVSMGPSRRMPYLESPLSFSPGGAMLTYALNLGGRTQIYVVNVDGTGLTQLTSPESGSSWPSFSH
jgi:TolB protein